MPRSHSLLAFALSYFNLCVLFFLSSGLAPFKSYLTVLTFILITCARRMACECSGQVGQSRRVQDPRRRAPLGPCICPAGGGAGCAAACLAGRLVGRAACLPACPPVCSPCRHLTGAALQGGLPAACAVALATAGEVLAAFAPGDCLCFSNVALTQHSCLPGRNKKPNQTGRTEPNRLILEPAGNGRGNKPTRGPCYGSPRRSKSRGRSPTESHRFQICCSPPLSGV